MVPTGAAFPVSSFWKSRIAGDQEKPTVALLPDGGAVVVWQGRPGSVKKNKKAGTERIYIRFINDDGSFNKKDILVSAHKKNEQVNPCVTVLQDGTVVVVWSSSGQDGDRQGIFGQRFSASGKKIGQEFQINQYTQNNQRTPAITALAHANFVVAWVSEFQPRILNGVNVSGLVDIYARIFDSQGNPVTGEFLVNTTTNLCANPALAASPQGGFAAAWSQNNDSVLTLGSQMGVTVSSAQSGMTTNSWDVFGRLFGDDGNTTSEPFRLNGYIYGDQYAPQISALGNQYMSVWTSLGQDGSREGVFGRSFQMDGTLIGSEIQVNTSTISRQIQPTIISDGVNRFMAIWSSFTGNGNFDLFAQQYLQSGE
jgi:hypothetical protein